jgi:hypothetical protein
MYIIIKLISSKPIPKIIVTITITVTVKVTIKKIILNISNIDIKYK